MPEQTRPTPPEQAQDPSYSYERSHPGREAGMGKLDANKPEKQDVPDQSTDVPNKQNVMRQINAQDTDA